MRLSSPAASRHLLLALFTTWGIFASAVAVRAAAAETSPGIAIAVVFDTSGSMGEPIATKVAAAKQPKYVVAGRAFEAVIARLETFARTHADQPLSVGVYVFADTKARVALPLAPFDPVRLRAWLKAMKPAGATPLGDAIYLAGRDLLAKPASARHILVLTDGATTNGRAPALVLDQISQAAGKRQVAVFTHIIALDIPPAIFASLQNHGATLIGATDETQLNAKFDFILEEKILVEAAR